MRFADRLIKKQLKDKLAKSLYRAYIHGYNSGFKKEDPLGEKEFEERFKMIFDKSIK